MSTIIGDIITIGGKLSGSGDEIYALIKVTYPAGSTCTATNGTTMLTAENTSGQVLFGIPEPASTPETWTVSCTNGTNSDSKTITITIYGQTEEVELNYLVIGETLNDTTWKNISKVSIAGTGDTYWDVGDCKAVTLNGTVGTLALNNVTLYVYIIDFNHPINNSIADNNIIWGGFKTALRNGIDVALCDTGYDSSYTNGTKYFNMNHWGGYNYGGWKGSDLRYDVLGGTSTAPSGYGSAKTTSSIGYDASANTFSNPVSNTLMAALPSDLRAVIRLWSRYIDCVGNKSNVDANCSTPTIDAISILAEFEILGSSVTGMGGTIGVANEYERNHQQRMAYYTAGNSRIKYKHNNTGTKCRWLDASPYRSNAGSIGTINEYGNWNSMSAASSYGLAPAFRT